jgi:capsular polysaccharide export protein
MESPRTVLLLQGPRSPFFARLAAALEARGARSLRVLFCPGDALFHRGRAALRWRGGLEPWPAAVAALMAREGVTDMIGLGDGRAPHRLAFAEARRSGVAVHVVEQGLLRPGYLTLEADGLGRWRPTAAELASAEPPPPCPSPGAGFPRFAAMDAAWDLANLALARWTYPGFRTHANPPLREWAGWGGKALRAPARARRRARTLGAIAAHRGPVFLFALQLEADYQIRLRGPAGGLRAALARACDSFARHAPPQARLAVKLHPLDPQTAPWGRIVRRASRGRAWLLDGGDLAALWPRLAGLVTANSTAGLEAIRAGVPTLALGEAVWDRPGLAHRSGLDRFWTAPEPPEPETARRFVAALAAATQVPGGFDGPAMAIGAAAVAERVLSRPALERAA